MSYENRNWFLIRTVSVPHMAHGVSISISMVIIAFYPKHIQIADEIIN